MKRALVALCLLSLGCGSDSAPADQAADPTDGAGANASASAGTSGQSSASEAGSGQAGSRGEAGAGRSSEAGASGLSGSMTMDAPVCTIPDDLQVTAEDGDDAGVPPDCQNVPRKIIANNCIGGICHDSSGPPAGGIDLMAPCVADRLLNKMSSCEDMLLLDPNNLERSFLYNKVSGVPGPRCGKLMPDGRRLADDQLRCMNAWIKAVLRAAKQ